MKYVWSFVLATFGILTGLFLNEKNKNKNAQEELASAQFDGKDKLLKYQQTQGQAQIQEANKQLDSVKKEQTKDLTPEETEAYWKARK